MRSSSEELRKEARSLIERACREADADAKRKLASRAFSLAQEAEAAERASFRVPGADK